jgi:copper transport protein
VLLQSVATVQLSEPFGVESPAYAAIRFVHFAAAILFIGVIAFRLAVLTRFARRRSGGSAIATELAQNLARWLIPLLIALSLTHILRLAAQHRVYFADSPWSAETLRPLLLQSNWGLAWLIAAVTIVIAFGAARAMQRGRLWPWLLTAACVAVLSWTMAMSGHAAAAEGPLAAMALDATHVVAAGTWVGSLFVMMFVVVPRLLKGLDSEPHVAIGSLVAAFSPIALTSATVLGATGAIATWRNVGSTALFLDSHYGRLILIKMGLVGITAALGAINWQRVLPRLGQASATASVRKSAAVELLAATCVLLVTAVLVATAMPSE